MVVVQIHRGRRIFRSTIVEPWVEYILLVTKEEDKDQDDKDSTTEEETDLKKRKSPTAMQLQVTDLRKTRKI